MNVLSLFDGISCGQLALKRANIRVSNYYASEIDANAIKVTQYNFPNTKQIGDITKINNLPQNIDLLIGGSPCQGFSYAGEGLNFNDPRSKLFFDFVKIKDDINPKYFLLENVNMKQEWLDVISKHMGVDPIRINSSFFSAQLRDRYYWTNIPILPFEDKKIYVSSIIDTNEQNYKKVNRTPSREIMWGGGINGKCPNLSTRDKSWALTTKQDRWNNAGLWPYEDFCRYITPIEAERLQTLPDNYTSILKETPRFHAIGNAWTVDVIAHIFKGISYD